MLTQKVDKKKNLIYAAVFGVIVIVIAGLLLKDRVFTGGGSVDENFFSTSAETKITHDSVKKLKADILNDDRYKKLKNNSVNIKDIADLKIGKKNPFMPD